MMRQASIRALAQTVKGLSYSIKYGREMQKIIQSSVTKNAPRMAERRPSSNLVSFKMTDACRLEAR